jgi:hypothetical protein
VSLLGTLRSIAKRVWRSTASRACCSLRREVGQAIASGFSNYANFSGRASWPEFWFWVLFAALGAIVTNDLPLRLRRRLTGNEAQRDFPFLEELANSGVTDYVAELIPVGMVTEAFSENGIGFSFATDCPECFGGERTPLDPGRAAVVAVVAAPARDCVVGLRGLELRANHAVAIEPISGRGPSGGFSAIKYR